MDSLYLLDDVPVICLVIHGMLTFAVICDYEDPKFRMPNYFRHGVHQKYSNRSQFVKPDLSLQLITPFLFLGRVLLPVNLFRGYWTSVAGTSPADPKQLGIEVSYIEAFLSAKRIKDTLSLNNPLTTC